MTVHCFVIVQVTLLQADDSSRALMKARSVNNVMGAPKPTIMQLHHKIAAKNVQATWKADDQRTRWQLLACRQVLPVQPVHPQP